VHGERCEPVAGEARAGQPGRDVELPARQPGRIGAADELAHQPVERLPAAAVHGRAAGHGERHPPAGAQHPPQFGEHGRRVVDQVHHERRRGYIEPAAVRADGQVQGGGVHQPYVEVGALGREQRNHARRRVDGRHRAPAVGGAHRDRTASGTDVEPARADRRVEQIDQPGREAAEERDDLVVAVGQAVKEAPGQRTSSTVSPPSA
jgi:hypothetical protein